MKRLPQPKRLSDRARYAMEFTEPEWTVIADALARSAHDLLDSPKRDLFITFVKSVEQIQKIDRAREELMDRVSRGDFEPTLF